MIHVILICIGSVLLAILVVLLCANARRSRFAAWRLTAGEFATPPTKFSPSRAPSVAPPSAGRLADVMELIAWPRRNAPPLELDELVDILWNNSEDELPLETKCVEAFGITLLRRDLLKLKLGDWINDEIINFYMALIVNRSECLRCYPKIYAFNTFFYSTLTEKGFAGVRKWTKSMDLFSNDMILIPVHRGAHWCLVVVDFPMEKLEFYDSTLSDGSPILMNVRKYLIEEHLEKKKMKLDLSHWFVESKKGIPTQKNGYDCGIFLCAFAECASRRAPIRFSQANMPRFRAQMTFEIYNSRLFMQT